LGWIHNVVGVKDLFQPLELMGVPGGPFIDDGGQVSVRPGKNSPFPEQHRGRVFIKCPDGFYLFKILGIIEEIELQAAGPVVFDGLQIDPQFLSRKP
jgi:hypothetical protein